LTLLIVPLAFTYDLVIALPAWTLCVHRAFASESRHRRALRVIAASIPVMTWLTITVFPWALSYMNFEFDVVATDHVLTPVVLAACLLLPRAANKMA
jgi:hypothetical protein